MRSKIQLSRGPCPTGFRRYTYYIEFPIGGEYCIEEEIDVDVRASPPVPPRRTERFIQGILARDYDPGGRIHSYEERFGLYA